MSKSPYFVSWMQVLISFIVSAVIFSGFFLLFLPPLIPQKAMSETLYNMKELRSAIQKMTLDGEFQANSIQWTTQNNKPISLEQLKAALIVGKYMTEESYVHATSAKKPARIWSATLPDCVTIYAVTTNDPDNTLLLSSKNWQGPDSTLSGEPFGDLGYVIFFKNGEGRVARGDSSDARISIGQGGEYNYQALK